VAAAHVERNQRTNIPLQLRFQHPGVLLNLEATPQILQQLLMLAVRMSSNHGLQGPMAAAQHDFWFAACLLPYFHLA
jgi:hypothetical protein